ncbi:MAG: tetraacyldisaccharide 4'-kinase [Planctomycetes bacterium]|nr:tetraacyldisaccharide 4'-kinase [Planctomycetota bacterium]
MSADRRERPPVAGWLAEVGETVYRAAITRRNRRFDTTAQPRAFPIPIISVGNLSVGGTGKTPMVATIARWMLDDAHRPAIVLRGYARHRGLPSDEEAEYLERFSGRVPVIANPDRAAAIEELLARNAADRVILDDGFQHRRVRRDADIVLIDATRDPFADRLLPAGWLREPVDSLSRAHAVVITHADRVSESDLRTLQRRITTVAPRAAVALAKHHWSALRVQGLHGAPDRIEPAASLRNKRVLIAAAIGHPNAFIEQAKAHDADIVSTTIRRDHHHWTQSETRALTAEAARLSAAVLTTLKDWVKFAPHLNSQSNPPAQLQANWLTPELDMSLTANERALRALCH